MVSVEDLYTRPMLLLGFVYCNLGLLVWLWESASNPRWGTRIRPVLQPQVLIIHK